MTRRFTPHLVLGSGLLAGLTTTLFLPSCDDGGGGGLAGNLLEQCGLVCDEQAFLDGKFAISGIPEVDAFFSAVLDFAGSVEAVARDIEVELDALYAMVGAEGAADFEAALRARLAAYIDVDAGFTVRAEPPRCEASLEVTANAAAECDVDVTPGKVDVRCQGACTIAADAAAECHAAGGLTCRGTPPGLECTGTCYGGCELAAQASCDGTCRGTCHAGNEQIQNFEGRCAGMCEGTCVVEAGASCDGKCTGTCEFTPPSGSCEGGLEARCSATVEADIDCKGECVGEVEPPMVSAACEAAVEAKAEAAVQCYPASLTFDYTFRPTVLGDADLRAEFRGFLHGLELRYGALLAALARAEGLTAVGVRLGDAGVAALDAVADELSASGNIKAQFGGVCAIKVLPTAADRVAGAVQLLGARVEASAEVTAALGR